MAVEDWSTTAASNTTLGGLSTQGSAPANTIDDIVRELMAQIAVFRTSGTTSFTATNFVIGHTATLSVGGNADKLQVWGTTAATGGVTLGMSSATAGTAAHLDFYRSKNASIGSATVVANGDTLGSIDWYGAQQTGTFATQTRGARIRAAVSAAVTSGAGGDMPSSLVFSTTADGGSDVTDRLTIDNTGLATFANDVTVSGAFTSLGIDDNATGERLQIADASIAVGSSTAASAYTINRPIDTGTLQILGGTSASSGGLTLFGSSHASTAGDCQLLGGSATASYLLDDSAAKHLFTGAAYISGTTRFAQDTTDTPGSGNNTTGAAIGSSGQSYFSAAAAHVMNRTADGAVCNFASGGTIQGSLNISGATFSLAAFFGVHWSQLADGSRPDILRGSVIDTIAQMSAWPGEAPEERLPCFKVSDVPGSKAVYGVFHCWDIDWTKTNDALIGSLGAYVIRMDAGETVQIGDFIESAGNGCGRVQADDILRASTVAKVTSTEVIETYSDGSYLVPCTLHCG
jgi:hypothetical protein